MFIIVFYARTRLHLILLEGPVSQIFRAYCHPKARQLSHTTVKWSITKTTTTAGSHFQDFPACLAVVPQASPLVRLKSTGLLRIHTTTTSTLKSVVNYSSGTIPFHQFDFKCFINPF